MTAGRRFAVLLVAAAACNSKWPADEPPDLSRRDMRRASDFGFEPWREDLAWDEDLGPPPEPCDERDPFCHIAHYGLPGMFPLQSDPMPDPLARDNGLYRDLNGALLEHQAIYTGYLWVPNTGDLGGAGTVSKLDARSVREVARYLSITCSSSKTGGAAPCDGTNGCCSLDDPARYAARLAKMPEPGHQSVQRTGNHPSRTAIDFNGDLVVANRAPGGQASITRIANDPSQCVDRNRNGKIDTSADTSGNGWIEEDCNGDGAPDDLAGVLARPCGNGLKQEFYGLDDECVLWTTNTFAPAARVNAIGLGAGIRGGSDAWVGASSGQFVRVDGTSGKIKLDAALPPDCSRAGGPWGMTIDASEIAWVTEQGPGKLCWLDTRNPPGTGVVRDPQWGPMVGDGIVVDRNQNVWIGGAVARYTPDRTNGVNNLGHGWWTRVGNAMGHGIEADTRTFKDYFVYSCGGASVLQIPASTIPVVKMDQTLPDPGWPTIKMPCMAVALDQSQNIWGIDAALSTRAKIDKNGVITQPVVNGPPMGKDKCPAGDSCAAVLAEPYSQIAWFYFFNGIRPYGTYSMLVPGCTDGGGTPAETEWWDITWDADVPPNTSLSVHARAGNAASLVDPSWVGAQWSPDAQLTPYLLQGVLSPNHPGDPPGAPNGWLQVEFVFKTQSQNATAKLRSFDVRYRCPPG